MEVVRATARKLRERGNHWEGGAAKEHVNHGARRVGLGTGGRPPEQHQRQDGVDLEHEKRSILHPPRRLSRQLLATLLGWVFVFHLVG